MRVPESDAPIVGSIDICTRPLVQRVSSVIELAFSILCFGYSDVSRPWPLIPLGTLLFWDAIRILGWKLDISPDGLRVRRYFLWRSISWAQIRAVEVGNTWGRGQKAVRLSLFSQPTLSLGAFGETFAIAVRDGLQTEILQRQDVTTSNSN